jgi:hypothetical protein
MPGLPSLARAPVFAIVALSAVAGCGSKGSGSGTPSDLSPAAKAKWDEYCAFSASCQSTPCSPSTCMAAIAEQGPLIEFVDCQIPKGCGANDDDCVAEAGTTDAEREAFVPRCEAVLSAGQAPPGCYVETVLCTIVAYPMIRKQYMRAVDACLALATCGDRKACIDAAMEPLNCF